MRLLVIDDSRAVRLVLSKFLGELGIESAQAGDGLEALEAFEGDLDFDGALVDWDMPRMNGLEFVQAIRERSEFDGKKLIMVTAQTSMGNVVEAINAGANDYLMKPLTKEMLEEKLRLVGLID
ncbi:MAG: response regulator [Pedosphaera sp.]|nr:response regulator [Pedosphaera sp.]